MTNLEQIVTGQEIIARIKERYRQCSTYQDRGIFKANPEMGSPNGLSFSTFFVRPDKFMMEFVGAKIPRRIIWSNGEQTYNYSYGTERDGKKAKKMHDLNDGMTFTASCGIPCFIPALLIEDLPQHQLFGNLFEVVQKDDSDEILLSCHCKPWLSIWLHVDSAQYSITRIAVEEFSEIPFYNNGVSKWVICDYADPRFDDPIPEDIFAFRPTKA